MKTTAAFCAFLLACTLVQARDTQYLPAGEPDGATLLAPPPEADSAEQAADLAEVRTVSRSVSKQEAAAALADSRFSIFSFTSAIGDFFQPGRFPRTEAFFRRVSKDTETEIDSAKEYWKRPRPYTVDRTLAEGKLEKSFSYPSGHSTGSMVMALVLADLFPAHRDAILARARLVGWHRVEIARHYPTDIYAGRVFAQAIVREMKKNPDFQRDFAAAKAELETARQAARN